ncbi:MAG: long-chain acyl-CoA synthetase, partial [Rubrobacteraceae bacterium]|nr:long-chain acyl-CoA synthetase [Rubrobacteraceae bacterium]
AALLAGNRVEWILACLAVIWVGAVVVPLDAQLGDKMLTHALNDSGAGFIFTTTEGADRLERLDIEAAPEPILLDVGEDDERSWRRLLVDRDVKLPAVPEPEDQAALFYTSGTTGTAKGVPLTHRNLTFQLNTLLDADLVTEEDRVMLPLPLHHVYPFVIGMLTPLAAGLPIIMPHALTGPQIIRALQEGDVSLVVGVPRLYDALYSGIEERARSGGWIAARLFEAGVGLNTWLRRRLGLRVGERLLRPVRNRLGPNLRVLASGGAALDPDLAWKLESLGWRVAVGYGLTETSPILTLNPPDGAKLESVGRPLSSVEVRVDPSAMPDESERQGSKTSEPHEEGEILARGPNVFSGYRNMPDKTEEVLADDGWYRTGDLGYFDDDGYLYVTGRASTLIVTEGGKNVQPEEVEEVYNESPTIREIGVLQKDGRLVAVIVPEVGEIRRREDGEIERAIREAVEEGSKRLPSYQRLSDYAVTREPLEYTQLGKLRRHLLEDRYNRAKEVEEGTGEAEAGPILPEEMSEEDRALLEDRAAKQVWELLARRYPDARLTPDTSPQLDLGVDSMEWVNLTMEIGESAGVELDEEAIDNIDTVRDLLRAVAEAAETGETASGASPLEQPEEVLSAEQKRWLEPLGSAMSFMAWGLFLLNRAIMRGLFRLRAEGLENLPERGPFVITPNHVSYLDSFVVAAALDYGLLRRTYWAGWTGAAFSNPLNRFVSRLAQTVPIDPDRAGVSSLAFGAAVLKREKNLVWFPEGERSPTGRLQPFKPGIGMLLNHFRVPVVPVFIHGTGEAMPRGKALVRPAKITVVFDKPLEVSDLEQQGEDGQPHDRIIQGLHDRMAELGGQS